MVRCNISRHLRTAELRTFSISAYEGPGRERKERPLLYVLTCRITGCTGALDQSWTEAATAIPPIASAMSECGKAAAPLPEEGGRERQREPARGRSGWVGAGRGARATGRRWAGEEKQRGLALCGRDERER
eukprot:scaffold14346_cov33-Tisochrysis_lutea.AAC.1